MKIIQKDKSGNIIAIHDNIKEAENALGIIGASSHIAKVCKGKRYQAYGYIWEYDTMNVHNMNWTKKDKGRIEADIPDTKESFTEEALMMEMNLNKDEWEAVEFKAGKHIGFIKNADKQIETVTLRNAKAIFKRKVWFKPDSKFYIEWLNDVARDLKGKLGKQSLDIKKGSFAIHSGDLHMGSLQKSDGNSYEATYNKDIAKERLLFMSNYANRQGGSPTISILGDFIESFTGANHANTWKYIESHGMEVALMAFDAIYGMISNLNSIDKLVLISGNHDRIGNKKDEDDKGQVAFLIKELFARVAPKLEVVFDNNVATFDTGGIRHICHHGHLGLSKKDLNRFIVDYGDLSKFNLIVGAHKHHRGIDFDTTNGRKIWIPSIVSTNNYASQLGEHSLSGFVHVEDFNGMPIISDIPFPNQI